MIKFLNISFILILILINNISAAKEEILFSVNNNVITTIDLTQRVNYLSVLNNFDVNNADNNINKEIIYTTEIMTNFLESFGITPEHMKKIRISSEGARFNSYMADMIGFINMMKCHLFRIYVLL